MMYELSKKNGYEEEIKEALAAKTKNSNYIETALNMQFSFPEVLKQLLDCNTDFKTKLRRLERQGLLGHDDFSITVHE